MLLFRSPVRLGPSASAPPASSAASLWRGLRPEPIDLTAPQLLSFRHPGRSPLFRLIAHVLVRLLIIGPLPPNLQAFAALFPVSLLWPLVSQKEAPGAAQGEEEAAPGAASLEAGDLGRDVGLAERSQPIDSGEGPDRALVRGEHSAVTVYRQAHVEGIVEACCVVEGEACRPADQNFRRHRRHIQADQVGNGVEPCLDGELTVENQAPEAVAYLGVDDVGSDELKSPDAKGAYEALSLFRQLLRDQPLDQNAGVDDVEHSLLVALFAQLAEDGGGVEEAVLSKETFSPGSNPLDERIGSLPIALGGLRGTGLQAVDEILDLGPLFGRQGFDLLEQAVRAHFIDLTQADLTPGFAEAEHTMEWFGGNVPRPLLVQPSGALDVRAGTGTSGTPEARGEGSGERRRQCRPASKLSFEGSPRFTAGVTVHGGGGGAGERDAGLRRVTACATCRGTFTCTAPAARCEGLPGRGRGTGIDTRSVEVLLDGVERPFTVGPVEAAWVPETPLGEGL